MSTKNKLTLPGRYENIRVICDFVSQGAKKSGLPSSDVFHIELACDEACTNIIEHAYEGENKGKISVEWQKSPTHFIVILRDNGRSFNPKHIPKPPENPDQLDDIKVGGLGLHFIRKLMDDIEFQFDSNGNVLTMRKKWKH